MNETDSWVKLMGILRLTTWFTIFPSESDLKDLSSYAQSNAEATNLNSTDAHWESKREKSNFLNLYYHEDTVDSDLCASQFLVLSEVSYAILVEGYTMEDIPGK